MLRSTLFAASCVSVSIFSHFVFAAPTDHSATKIYEVPGNDTFPEGVAFQPNSPYFYTGSTITGTIYRGTFSSPTMKPFITSGLRSAIGMVIHGDNLIVAGGTTGAVGIYSISRRELTHKFSTGLPPDTPSILNDVAVDGRTGDVYISDSFFPMVWKVSGGAYLRKGAPTEQSLERAVSLNGTEIAYQAGAYNGNGIAVMPDGRYLLLADSSDQELYRVSLNSKSVKRVDLGPGHPIEGIDGMKYHGSHLYTVAANVEHPEAVRIYVTQLEAPYLKGTVKGSFRDEHMYGSSTMDFVDVKKKEILVCNFQYFAENPLLPFTVIRTRIPERLESV